jgi:hypothetical protein
MVCTHRVGHQWFRVAWPQQSPPPPCGEGLGVGVFQTQLSCCKEGYQVSEGKAREASSRCDRYS